MEVYECIRTRRTVRNFKPDAIPEAVVNKILRAGRWAPSSSNTQPWQFVVIRNRETLKTLGGIAAQGTFIADAPLAIVICMKDAFRPDLDAGRALQQMELVAWSEGMGTCFVGFREAEQARQVKELLNIPDDVDMITILPFGYREEGFKGQGTPRKPMSEIVHNERYGEAYTTE